MMNAAFGMRSYCVFFHLRHRFNGGTSPGVRGRLRMKEAGSPYLLALQPGELSQSD